MFKIWTQNIFQEFQRHGTMYYGYQYVHIAPTSDVFSHTVEGSNVFSGQKSGHTTTKAVTSYVPKLDFGGSRVPARKSL